jgi:hypothetical protein
MAAALREAVRKTSDLKRTNTGGVKDGRLATPFYNLLPLRNLIMLRKALLSVVPVLLLGTAVWAVPQGATKTVPVSDVKVVKESDSDDAGAGKRGKGKKSKKGKKGRKHRENRSYKEHRREREHRGHREDRDYRENREERGKGERGWFDFGGYSGGEDGDCDDDC